MLNEIMLQKNSEIIDALSRWRSMTTENLKAQIACVESGPAFRQRILRLEKGGVLKSKLQKGFNKIVYPSKELLGRLGIENFNEDNIRHDAVVSMVVSSLLNFKKVTSGKLPHEYKTKSSWRHHAIEPDAIMTIDHNRDELTVAVEVELWRKERKRVFDKLIEYAKAHEYDNVFYFFADRSSFESYKKRLTELLSDAQFDHLKEDLAGKIIFIFNQSILKNVLSLSDSEAFHEGATKKLGDLLED
ncbi:MAG: hypothetical protein ACXVLQ_14520 [Bacteriovorax sp.]